MLRIFILGSLFGSIFAQNSFELRTDDKCLSSLTNSEGVCVEPHSCDYYEEHRNNLNICSFNGRIPIVCCPENEDRVIQKSAISEITTQDSKEN